MIKEGETVFLDASTSSLHLARNIKRIKRNHGYNKCRKIVAELAECDNIRVICTGGMLHKKNMSYIGRIVEETIRANYYANKVFFSCRGVTLNRGLMESTEAEADKKSDDRKFESAIFLCDKQNSADSACLLFRALIGLIVLLPI